MANFIITTTGTAPTITISELDITLTHPESFNSNTEGFSDTDILDATDLHTALAAGEVTVTDLSLNSITNLSLSDIVVDLENAITSSGNPVSTDAGNLITQGGDSKAFLDQAVIQANETTTSLSYNAGTTTLTYTDEDGTDTDVDLSALTTDIYVDGASFNATSMALTLTDNDGGTADVVVDLSTMRSVYTNNNDGTYTLDDGNGATTTVTTTSGDAGNLITNGSDDGPFLNQAVIQANETTTSISWQGLTQTLTYTDEDGSDTNLVLTQTLNQNTDVDAALPLDGQYLAYNNGTGNWEPLTPPVYGTNFNVFTAATGSPQTTTANTYTDVINSSTSALEAGNYMVDISYSWNHNQNTNDFQSRFLFGGASVGVNSAGELHRQESKDNAGSFEGTGSNQQYSFHKRYYVSGVTAGAKTVQLEFRSDVAGVESAIWDAVITVVRVS